MKALIVIDFTQDFVTGALPVGQPAVEIQETVAAITKAYLDNKDEVIMAVDLHEKMTLIIRKPYFSRLITSVILREDSYMVVLPK